MKSQRNVGLFLDFLTGNICEFNWFDMEIPNSGSKLDLIRLINFRNNHRKASDSEI